MIDIDIPMVIAVTSTCTVVAMLVTLRFFTRQIERQHARLRHPSTWQPCHHVITVGNGQEAWCVLREGHSPKVEHATTLAALEACGYVQPVF